MTLKGFGDTGDVPDGAWFGQLRMYRQWACGRYFMSAALRRFYGNPQDTPGALTGVTYQHPWSPGWNDSVCYRLLDWASGEVDPDEEQRPHEGCGCGYWGYWRPNGHAFYNFGADELVFGVAEVGGRVRVGDVGVRAEKARILAVAAPPKLWPPLREQYPDIELFGGRRSLLRAYPPQDVSGLIGVSAEKALHDHELARWRQDKGGKKQYGKVRAQVVKRQRELGADSLAYVRSAVRAGLSNGGPNSSTGYAFGGRRFSSSSFAGPFGGVVGNTPVSASTYQITVPPSAFTLSLASVSRAGSNLHGLGHAVDKAIAEMNEPNALKKVSWWRRVWDQVRGLFR